MNFQSLLDYSPNKQEFKPGNHPQYSGSSYSNSYLSPPPSGGSDDEFQEVVKFAAPYPIAKPSTSGASGSDGPFKTGRNIHWFSNYAQNVKKDSVSKIQAPLKPKAFPNLIRNLNVNKGENDFSNKRPLPSPKKGQIITCYTCNGQVRSTELEQHLFFGSAKCKDCERLVGECSDYSSSKISHYGKDRNCPHNMWEFMVKPVDYLQTQLRDDDHHKTFKKALSKYVNSLHPLKTVRPYKKAIESCNEYLRFSSVKERKESKNPSSISLPAKHKEKKNSQPHTNNTFHEKPKPKTEPRVKKRKSELFDNIELPEDGHYLIERKPIEECPNCYTELSPKDLIFNIDTWLISVKCKECYLSIYFVLDPPDGSTPRLQITFS